MGSLILHQRMSWRSCEIREEWRCWGYWCSPTNFPYFELQRLAQCHTESRSLRKYEEWMTMSKALLVFKNNMKATMKGPCLMLFLSRGFYRRMVHELNLVPSNQDIHLKMSPDKNNLIFFLSLFIICFLPLSFSFFLFSFPPSFFGNVCNY